MNKASPGVSSASHRESKSFRPGGPTLDVPVPRAGEPPRGGEWWPVPWGDNSISGPARGFPPFPPRARWAPVPGMLARPGGGCPLFLPLDDVERQSRPPFDEPFIRQDLQRLLRGLDADAELAGYRPCARHGGVFRDLTRGDPFPQDGRDLHVAAGVSRHHYTVTHRAGGRLRGVNACDLACRVPESSRHHDSDQVTIACESE